MSDFWCPAFPIAFDAGRVSLRLGTWRRCFCSMFVSKKLSQRMFAGGNCALAVGSIFTVVPRFAGTRRDLSFFGCLSFKFKIAYGLIPCSPFPPRTRWFKNAVTASWVERPPRSRLASQNGNGGDLHKGSPPIFLKFIVKNSFFDSSKKLINTVVE